MLIDAQSLALRPRFRFTSEMSRNEIIEKFRKELNENNPEGFTGVLTDFHIQIRFPAHKHRIWTPYMEIGLEENLQDKTTLVRVLLTPVSPVWMLVAFLLIVTSTSIFISLMLGISQVMIEQEPWGFYVAGLCTVILLGLYLIARQGRLLARKEMPELKKFADQVFECDCLMKAH